MSDIKLITIDIDKTLIDDNMEIPQVNVDVINRVVNKGCNVTLCSGRSGASVRKYLVKLGIESLVPSLGGCMLAKWDGSVVQDHGISCEDALKIYEIAGKYDLHPFAFKLEDWYTNPENTFWIEREIAATGNVGIYLDMKEFLAANRPNKMLIPSLNAEVSEVVMKEINNLTGNRVICFLSSPTYIEAMPNGINKGTAVENLIDFYGIKRDNVLSIGDFYNDVDMFNAAGNTACPSNAPEDIRIMVDYVSPMDNNNGAVAEIIRHFCNV